MEKSELNRLPELTVYALDPRQAERISSLLSAEALELLCRGDAAGLAVVEENEVRGAICVRFAQEQENTLELCSLYVVPQYRRRGLGGTLLAEALERSLMVTDGLISRVDCLFSSSTEGMDEFLRASGFKIGTAEHSGVWRVTLAEAESGPLSRRETQSAQEAVSLGELSAYQIRMLMKTLRKNRADNISEEMLRTVVPEISFAIPDGRDGGGFDACVVWTGGREQGLCLRQFFCMPQRAGTARAILQLSLRAMLERYPPETVLEIPVLTDSSEKLVRKLTGAEAPQESLRHAVLEI